MLTKNICTIAMIHSKVKQIRYKYRYGCNMTKAEKIEKKIHAHEHGANKVISHGWHFSEHFFTSHLKHC